MPVAEMPVVFPPVKDVSTSLYVISVITYNYY